MVRVLLSGKVQKIESANAEKKVIVQKSAIPHEGATEGVLVSQDEFFEVAMKQNIKPQTKSSKTNQSRLLSGNSN